MKIGIKVTCILLTEKQPRRKKYMVNIIKYNQNRDLHRLNINVCKSKMGKRFM